MPNGYGYVMKILTKITKVPFSVLRMQVHTRVAYVDDSYLQENCKDCRTQKIVTTVKIVGLKKHRQNCDAEIELSIEACK